MGACPDREQLEQLLDERGEPAALAHIQAHVDTCSACTDRLEQLTRGDLLDLPLPLLGLVPLRQTLEGCPGNGQGIALPSGAAASPGPLGPTLPIQLLGEVARGGMGVVHKGRDELLQRELAVKVLREQYHDDPAVIRRFQREAHILGRLQHPAIVPIHEVGTLPDGRHCFTMKLVQGETLAKLLAARPDPHTDLSRFLAVFELACQALAFAHAQGVVHRDLKPANVMVGSFGEVYVMDWGLAKMLADEQVGGKGARAMVETVYDLESTALAEEPGSASRSGLVMGTLSYIAPEQARGAVDELDERGDVFGLGAILCEILTGEPPYVGRTVEELRGQAERGALADAWTRLEGCGTDAELLRLAKSCLAPVKSDRPRHAGAVAQALKDYLASVQERLRRAEREQAAAQVKAAEERKRRKLLAALVAAGLLLTSLTAGAAGWYQRDRAARLVAAEHDVTAALQEATTLIARGWEQTDDPDRWQATLGLAQEALELAERRLHTEKPTKELRARVRVVRGEWEQADDGCRLIAKLEQVHLQRAETVQGPREVYNHNLAFQYAKVFAQHGWEVLGPDCDAVTKRLRHHRLWEQLLAALEDWALCSPEKAERERLAEVLRAVDPGAEFHIRWREALARQDREALARLAGQVDVTTLSARVLERMGRALDSVGAEKAAVQLLRQGQVLYRNDFWLNMQLGIVLYKNKPSQPQQAVTYFMTAVGIRSRSPLAYNNLGLALEAQGDRAEAVRCFRAAIEHAPKYAPAHNNLGLALEAQGDRAEAIRHYHAAIEHAPKYAPARNNLGLALEAQRDRAEAIRHYRAAIQHDPKYAMAYYNLGWALLQQGQFIEARQSTQRALDLYPAGHPFRPHALQQLRQCEQMVQLDEKLPAIRKGGVEPADAAERLALATLCGYKQQYAAAAHFYREAFEQPEQPVSPADRYNAACVAALAAAGQGKDADQLDDKEQARLRALALGWLQAELARWTKEVDKGTPQARTSVQGTLTHWQQDPDLTSLRGPEALAKLPEEERPAWQKLWEDVAALHARVSAAKDPR